MLRFGELAVVAMTSAAIAITARSAANEAPRTWFIQNVRFEDGVHWWFTRSDRPVHEEKFYMSKRFVQTLRGVLMVAVLLVDLSKLELE